jgi:hypothetical protein
MRNLFNGIILLTIGQAIVWFQTNGQFVWPFFKRNPLIIALIGGSIVSYTFILGTKELAAYYEGALWPGRFIGFTVGMFTFSALTYLMMNEGINTKTGISLILAAILLGVQLFWK